jgi:hypothetical protein
MDKAWFSYLIVSISVQSYGEPSRHINAPSALHAASISGLHHATQYIRDKSQHTPRPPSFAGLPISHQCLVAEYIIHFFHSAKTIY